MHLLESDTHTILGFTALVGQKKNPNNKTVGTSKDQVLPVKWKKEPWQCDKLINRERTPEGTEEHEKCGSRQECGQPPGSPVKPPQLQCSSEHGASPTGPCSGRGGGRQPSHSETSAIFPAVDSTWRFRMGVRRYLTSKIIYLSIKTNRHGNEKICVKIKREISKHKITPWSLQVMPQSPWRQVSNVLPH